MDELNRDMNILIVDDSSSMRRIVTKFLANNGFSNLIEAVDGLTALEAVRNNTIDLIISDLNMPKMNGLEFLELIKAEESTRKIPFIMLTVEAIQKTMNKAIAMGVDSYIVKPIAEHVFIEELMRVLKEQ